MTGKILCALMFLMFLTSCAQFEFSPENLMRPPKLTQEQLEISTALEEAVGDKNIKYRYPENGEHRSSFVFHDLDNDGEDEALAFYQAGSKGPSTWITILDHEEDGWHSVFDIAAPSHETSIDFVEFRPLLSSEKDNIVIGWTDEYLNEKSVVVYSYEKNSLVTEFDHYYSQLSFLDINNDSRLDLLIVTDDSFSSDSTVTLVTRMVSLSGKPVLREVDSQPLPYGLSDVSQLLSGKIDSETNALFIDSSINSRRGENALVTQAITADGNRLRNLLGSGEDSLAFSTIRRTSILCQDIDQDGIIEIPTVSPLPGYEPDNDEEVIYLTTFNKLLMPNQFVPVTQCAVNEANRYKVTFPSGWIGNVTISNQPETGEWSFQRYDGTSDEVFVPLLRIRVYSSKDYHDKFETDYFDLLGKQGLFEYYAYIPESTDPLSITRDQLNTMFSFIQ